MSRKTLCVLATVFLFTLILCHVLLIPCCPPRPLFPVMSSLLPTPSLGLISSVTSSESRSYRTLFFSLVTLALIYSFTHLFLNEL